MAFLYLAASEESTSPWSHGSGRSPTVKTTDTRKLYFCPSCERVEFLSLQSASTCGHLEATALGLLSTSSPAAAHARISALQEMERAWLESAADCSSRSSDSLAIFDQNSFSWRTSQLSLDGALSAFQWNSPRWGTIHGGLLFQRRRLAPATYENDGSFWPTIVARDYRQSDPKGDKSPSLVKFLCEKTGLRSIRLKPSWAEMFMGYPSGHTELSEWAMRWYRTRRVKLSKDLSDSGVSA